MGTAQIELRDGRTLAVDEVGDPSGFPVVHCHGTPSSRAELNYFGAAFAAVGLRVVVPDRPGMGGSSPCPDRDLAGWADDVAQLADALGLDRFVVTGLSGGGPFAATCCALLADRVVGGVICGGGPDLSWPGARVGYVPLELELVDAPGDAAAVELCADAIGVDGSGFLESDALDWPEPDLALFADDDFAAHVGGVVGEAFRQGVAGYVHDVRANGRPWPFDPGEVRVPITIVHGAEDTVVPVEHARLAAERLHGAELRVLPGHGHLTPLFELPAIVAAVRPS